jgi:hypothetical protein
MFDIPIKLDLFTMIIMYLSGKYQVKQTKKTNKKQTKKS